MVARITAYLRKQDCITITTAGLLLVVLLGIIDFASGYEISFSIFYLGPISLVAWLAGQRHGYAVAVISAVVWLVADFATGHVFTHSLIPFWNALVRCGFFLIIVAALSQLRRAYEAQIRIAHELRDALATLKILRGLIPICAWCKKIRNDQGYWQQVEAYITEHSDASFTHGMCPECQEKALESLPRRRL